PLAATGAALSAPQTARQYGRPGKLAHRLYPAHRPPDGPFPGRVWTVLPLAVPGPSLLGRGAAVLAVSGSRRTPAAAHRRQRRPVQCAAAGSRPGHLGNPGRAV